MIHRYGDDTEVWKLAQEVINNPAHIQIAHLAAKRLKVPQGMAFHELRFQLAYAYAQGYVRGWKRARSERTDHMPPPEAGTL